MSAYLELLDRSKGCGLPAAHAEPFFTTLSGIATAYSDLERTVLGDIDVAFPAHLLLPGRPVFPGPIEEGVDLAERERSRLGLGREPVSGLVELLERENLKVLVGLYTGSAPLIGGFSFRREWGPALFVNGAGGRREAEYRAAHLYGHFLRDLDPYETRVCVHGSAAGVSDPAEVRAEAFAGAFLVSGEWASDYLVASGLKQGVIPGSDVLLALREYFDTSIRAVLSRLLSSAWLRAEDLPALAGDQRLFDADPPAPVLPEDPLLAYPGRYVSLAVRAHRDGVISLRDLAERLRLPAEDAADLLHSYGVEVES